MFAMLNKNIRSNAGQWLAFILQAFFMSAYLVVTRYRYLCTPVYRLNGRTAFGRKCVKQRDRHGYFFYLLCVTFTTLPTLHCLAATERQPAKTAHNLPPILTHTSMDWASTFRTSPSSSCVNPTEAVRSSQGYSTFAASISQPEHRISMPCFIACCASSETNKPGTSIAGSRRSSATAVPSSSIIPMLRSCRHTFLKRLFHIPGSRLQPALVGCTGITIPKKSVYVPQVFYG